MSDKVQVRAPFDFIKWMVALLLVAVAIFGNWYFAESLALLYRVLVIVGLSIFAVVIVATTIKGRSFFDMLLESRAEVRKVIWPTQQETRQTTLIVVVVVIIMALILWGLDSFLSYLVKFLIG